MKKDIIKRPEHFVNTGFLELDEMLKNINYGSIITIGSRPAMGKTAFMLNILRNISESDKKSILFSLEMSEEQLIRRLLSQMTEIDIGKIKSVNLCLEELNLIYQTTEKINNSNFIIDDTQNVKPEYIEEKIKETKPKFVFIDYFQLIKSSEPKDRMTEIKYIAEELKRIAKENRIVIFVSTSLSRITEEREDKHPQLSDLREPDILGKVSDVVVFIYRSDYYAKEKDYIPNNTAEIIVAKNNFGSCGTINLKFIPNLTKFANL